MDSAGLTDSSAEDVRGGEGVIPSIPYEMAVLANGLTLIVHENRRHPIVCTQLRFNVGSKDEPPGRTGFAHLFEHLMFKESAHRRGNWHKMLHDMGGANVNGTTNPDRTNYYQTVPKAALDRLLWMESDRMGHLIGGLNETTLADEVSVVKNEKRQREGAPYGGVFEAVTTTLYPKEHPYGHTVLGSFEDLDNADLTTVADWHARWYGASNAVLVIAGDIDFKEALAKVERWFGAMPAGTPARRVKRWLPEVGETKRIAMEDRVPFRRLYSIWVSPPSADPESTLLSMAAQILSGGSHSRLQQRLVDRDRLCLGIQATQGGRQLSGEFHIIATLAPGIELAAVKEAIADELARFIAEGPAQKELDRIRDASMRELVGRLDNIGQVADVLASNMFLFGRPDGDRIWIDAVEAATTETVRKAAAKWLAKEALELDVRPFEAVQAAADAADRSAAPSLGVVHAPAFPRVEHARLDNGLSIQLARQPGTQGCNFALYLDNGSILDPIGLEGLSQLSLGMLKAGTERHSKVALAERLSERGIGLGVNVSRDFSSLAVKALRDDVGQAMDFMAELLLQPVFPENELALSLQRTIANAQGRAISPGGAADMALSPLLFGPGHYYGRQGGGTPESLARITREQVIGRYRAWLDPRRATLVAVGDMNLDQLVAMAERSFGRWSPKGSPTTIDHRPWSTSAGTYFIDRPGTAQTTLRIAMADGGIALGNEALMIFNSLFGGAFGSRLNANLRERRGWTYGASSALVVSRQLGSFRIQTEVQGDRTMDAIAEIESELVALVKDRPVTEEEIEVARNGLLVALPGRWSSNLAVLNALIERLHFDLPEDYQDGIEGRIRGVGRKDVDAVVEMLGDWSRYVCVAAGDPANIRGAEFVRIDAEGNRL